MSLGIELSPSSLLSIHDQVRRTVLSHAFRSLSNTDGPTASALTDYLKSPERTSRSTRTPLRQGGADGAVEAYGGGGAVAAARASSSSPLGALAADLRGIADAVHCRMLCALGLNDLVVLGALLKIPAALEMVAAKSKQGGDEGEGRKRQRTIGKEAMVRELEFYHYTVNPLGQRKRRQPAELDIPVTVLSTADRKKMAAAARKEEQAKAAKTAQDGDKEADRGVDKEAEKENARVQAEREAGRAAEEVAQAERAAKAAALAAEKAAAKAAAKAAKAEAKAAEKAAKAAERAEARRLRRQEEEKEKKAKAEAEAKKAKLEKQQRDQAAIMEAQASSRREAGAGAGAGATATAAAAAAGTPKVLSNLPSYAFGGNPFMSPLAALYVSDDSRSRSYNAHAGIYENELASSASGEDSGDEPACAAAPADDDDDNASSASVSSRSSSSRSDSSDDDDDDQGVTLMVDGRGAFTATAPRGAHHTASMLQGKTPPQQQQPLSTGDDEATLFIHKAVVREGVLTVEKGAELLLRREIPFPTASGMLACGSVAEARAFVVSVYEDLHKKKTIIFDHGTAYI